MPSPSRFTFDLPAREVSFDYDPRDYHREAVLGTALVFTPRCFAFLGSTPRGRKRVTLQLKEPAGKAELHRLAGEFGNEMLNQTLRWMVAKHNKNTKDLIITQALLSARTPPKPAQKPAQKPAPKTDAERTPAAQAPAAQAPAKQQSATGAR